MSQVRGKRRQERDLAHCYFQVLFAFSNPDHMTGDTSEEKTKRARAATQIAIWAATDSWEGPLREYAVCATAQTSEKSISDLDRRLKFFRWEVSALIDRKVLDVKETNQSHIDLLNEIFFEDLGFRRQLGPAALETVIAKRLAPPALLAMLYGWVAELFTASCRAFDVEPQFSRIEIVHGVPGEVVRMIPVQDDGRVFLYDLQVEGQQVQDETWSPWCKSAPKGFSRKTFAEALTTALTELFVSLERDRTLETLQQQLSILDTIIALQPSETSRWADRAVLNSRLGNRPRALDDLKRFFAFHEKEKAPPALLSLYDDLRTEI